VGASRRLQTCTTVPMPAHFRPDFPTRTVSVSCRSRGPEGPDVFLVSPRKRVCHRIIHANYVTVTKQRGVTRVHRTRGWTARPVVEDACGTNGRRLRQVERRQAASLFRPRRANHRVPSAGCAVPTPPWTRSPTSGLKLTTPWASRTNDPPISRLVETMRNTKPCATNSLPTNRCNVAAQHHSQ